MGLFVNDITALCNFCKPKISGIPNDFCRVGSSGGENGETVQDIVDLYL